MPYDLHRWYAGGRECWYRAARLAKTLRRAGAEAGMVTVGVASMTYVTLAYPTIRSSFQLVVARGESFPRFIFQGFAMPSAAEKTLPLP